GLDRKPLAEPHGEGATAPRDSRSGPETGDAAGAPLAADGGGPGGTYTAAGFDRQVRTLLEHQDARGAARVREAADLGCTGWVDGGERRILAVDQGTFRGHPVTVAVRADAHAPETRAEAVIVPRNCAPPGDPLHRQRGISRP
ncbi:MAG: hypothetical protein ACRDPT_07360, partial [Streptomycetales bacterium]